jgi:hypothetical protein
MGAQAGHQVWRRLGCVVLFRALGCKALPTDRGLARSPVIYQRGPVFYHSEYALGARLRPPRMDGPDRAWEMGRSYSVVVLPTRAGADVGLPPVPPAVGVGVHAPLSWPLLANVGRVNSQVVKDLLLLWVVVPDDVGAEDVRSPAILGRLGVYEVPVRRWVPDRDRT